MPRKAGKKAGRKMRKARGLPYGGNKPYGGALPYGGNRPYGGRREGGWIGALLGTLGSALLPSVLPHLMEGN
jgi:hypothetical protein